MLQLSILIYPNCLGFPKEKTNDLSKDKQHRYAILICARNEEIVIADLIQSIKQQTYPSHLIRIFVLADNCTDGTAEIAKKHGATVYQRFDQEKIGKGYALEELMNHINNDYPNQFDGYFVFDADNILSNDYITQMNHTFAMGHPIVTSYRNSKNFGSNWISAGYALWFLRESKYLNYARHLLHSSCNVSGTGFLFSQEVADEIGGWPFHMLTEDIEFSINQIVHGRKIAFCPYAELYDEQPIKFSQSWRQRIRWSRGYLQVFSGYGLQLIKGALKGNFACFDMSMTIMPAFFLTAFSIFSNIALGVWGAYIGDDIMIAVKSIGQSLGNMYLVLFILGTIATITEWKHIHTSTVKKILFNFTFPLFMLSYLPISFVALFSHAGWKPIEHTMSMNPLVFETQKSHSN